MNPKSQSNEIKIIRIFDAPPKAVWDAWTDPEQVVQWWGPRGFTLTTHDKDLRTGGHWHYTMHGPDGTDYPNRTQYLEVEEYSKLVYDHGGYDDRPPLFRVTVLFSEEAGGKTKMDMRMTLATAEAAQEIRKFIKKAGGESTWDRLAEYLEKESTGREKFVINRSFDAPIGLMFEMWTNPAHVSQWLPPRGFEMRYLRSDIKPGGTTFYLMTNGDMKMHGRITYQKIEKPIHIVYTQQFCDENEQICRPPMMPVWPESMLTFVTLAEEGPERTRVTVTWEPHGAATREELEAFIKMRASMTQGWTGSFDKLEDLLVEKV